MAASTGLLRPQTLLLALATILLIYGAGYMLSSGNGPTMPNAYGKVTGSLPDLSSIGMGKRPTTPQTPSKPADTANLPDFKTIGEKHGTNKVTYHHYETMYEKFLPSIRNRNVKMLEIGLGCTMDYGPGKSYTTWLDYFPQVQLYFVEVDAECAAKWRDSSPGATIFAGDQANATFLAEIVSQVGGNFDLIIDDGGHLPYQQIASFENLWASVKPGGIYVIEDMYFSLDASWEGDPTAKNPQIPTALKYLYEMIDDMMFEFDPSPRIKHPFSKEIRSIECVPGGCTIYKK